MKIERNTINRLILVLVLSILSITLYARDIEEWNEALIDSIIEEVDDFSALNQRRYATIDSMVNLRKSKPLSKERVQLGEVIGRRYVYVNVDSALMFWALSANDARMLGDDEYKQRLELYSISIMPRSGITIEAVDKFSKVDPANFSDEMRRLYWLCASELYNNIQERYPSGSYKEKYLKLTIQSLDSVKSYYPINSPVASFTEAQIKRLNGENNLAVAQMIEMLPRLQDHSNLYDVALHYIVNYYADREQYKTQYINYLLRMCIHELRTGMIRPYVLASTGKVLDEKGYSLAAQRFVTMATAIPYVSLYDKEAFDRASFSRFLADKTMSQLKISIFIALILFVLIMMLLVFLIRQRRLMKYLQNQLSENEARHEHTLEDMQKVSSNILSMALLSDEQLKEYNRHVHRKLNAGLVKDLYQEVQSGEYLRNLNEKFFATFDESFLETFPKFVEKLNELFVPGRELSLLPGRRMSPELRIAAFMRLGITDSSKLALALDLSVNTIYTYRNRLKGRAEDRQNFDKNVQTIDFFS